MKVDSIFDRFITSTSMPFEADQPLMPLAEINRALDAIEAAVTDAQIKVLTQQTEALLQQATPFLTTGDIAGVAALTWSADVALQPAIYAAWSYGWQAGGAHMMQEMLAAVPGELLGAVANQQFGVHNCGLLQLQRFASPQDLAAIAGLLKLQPAALVNTPAETAALRRVNRISGNFSRDQLATLRTDLIAAMSPDADGRVLSRRDLLQRIEANLAVGTARASAIARTELTYAYNTSRIATAVQSPLVTHFRFLAISDLRTTDICRSRNGLVFKAEEATNYRPPLHVNCRSTLSPVMGRINPTHQGWIDDPGRSPDGRELTPLPKGWILDEAPKPPAKPAPAPAPTPPKKPTAKKAPAFPKSLDKLEEVRPLGGSTGATLVRDPATGKQFVLKRGNSADHLREEFAADEAYRALGVPVPKAKLYDLPGGPVKLAEYIEGESLAAVIRRGGQEAVTAIAQLQKNFAADALLGNWDVAGLDLDNILVGKDGIAYRIDNGGSLRFRAQGAPKGDRWNIYPAELFTLRNPAVNGQTAQIFGGLSHADLVDQMERLVKQEKKLLKVLPAELHDTIKGRLMEMQHLSKVSRTLLNDQWTDDYTSRFARHTLGLREAGIVGRMPKELRQIGGEGVFVQDELGRSFDSLRGRGSLVEDLSVYMSRNGASHDIISQYMANQGGDSWNEEPAAFKFWLANQRNVPSDRYFWRYGLDYSKQAYDEAVTQWGREKYADSLASWHAFNHELLQKADFNLKGKNGIALIRTESKDVMSIYGLKPGDKGKLMPRGFAESFSIYEKVTVYGSELTQQQVPLHRVFGTYWTEKYPGQGGSGFLGDRENEFVAMTDGIPFDYIPHAKRPRKGKKPPNPGVGNLLDDDDDLDLDELLNLLGDD